MSGVGASKNKKTGTIKSSNAMEEVSQISHKRNRSALESTYSPPATASVSNGNARRHIKGRGKGVAPSRGKKKHKGPQDDFAGDSVSGAGRGGGPDEGRGTGSVYDVGMEGGFSVSA